MLAETITPVAVSLGSRLLAFNLTRDMRGEARMTECAFGTRNSALADALAFLNEQIKPLAA